MQELQKTRAVQLRHLGDDLHKNLDDCRQHPGLGEEGEARHRLQHGALHRRRCSATPTSANTVQADRARRRADAQVLPRPRAHGSAARRAELHLHALRRHDRATAITGWRRARSRRRASCSIPNGGLFFCENSEVVGNVLDEDPEELYFRDASQEHRDWIRDEKCPTCLSPCQMNVAAVKQVVPYVKFLVRAAREKRRSAAAQHSGRGRVRFGLTTRVHAVIPRHRPGRPVFRRPRVRGSLQAAPQGSAHPAHARHQRLRRWRVDRRGAAISGRQPRAVRLSEERVAPRARAGDLSARRSSRCSTPGCRTVCRATEAVAAVRQRSAGVPAVAERLEAFIRELDTDAAGRSTSTTAASAIWCLPDRFLRNGRQFNAAVDDYCALVGLPAGVIENVTDGTNAYLVAHRRRRRRARQRGRDRRGARAEPHSGNLSDRSAAVRSRSRTAETGATRGARSAFFESHRAQRWPSTRAWPRSSPRPI